MTHNYRNQPVALFSSTGELQLTKSIWRGILQNSDEREEIERNFSANFSRLMEEDPRSTVELSRDLHVSRSSLDRWKEGGIKPQYQKLLDIADCFSVTPVELIAPPVTSGKGRS